jgi:hypothetical protein
MKKILGISLFLGFSIFIIAAVMSPHRKAQAQMDLLRTQVQEAMAAEKFDRYCALEIKEVIDVALVAGTGEARKKELGRHNSHIAPVRERAQKALTELRASMKATEHSGLDDGEGTRLVVGAEAVYAKLPPLETRILDVAKNSGNNDAAAALLRDQYLPLVNQILSRTEQISQNREAEMEAGISRLSGELDGVILYSGQAQSNIRAMNASASQSAQGRAFIHLFAQQLINAESYLLTVDPQYPYKILDGNKALENVLMNWKNEESKDPEPDRSQELHQLAQLEAATNEFRSTTERMLKLMAEGQREAANHLIEKALDPIIYLQILALTAGPVGLPGHQEMAGADARIYSSQTVSDDLAQGLAERDEKELFDHLEFIGRRLSLAMWLTGCLLILTLTAAIAGFWLLLRN